jgi:hypothetical protein
MTALGALALSAPATSPAYADAPGWQFVGSSNFYARADYSYCYTKNISVDGGSVLAKYYRPGNDSWAAIQVWEYDPDNPDDFVITIDLQDGAQEDFNADSFDDGSNGKAELYFRGPCTGAPWVSVYD